MFFSTGIRFQLFDYTHNQDHTIYTEKYIKKKTLKDKIRRIQGGMAIVRERQIPYDFTHVESNEQTELTSKIETDS